MSWVKYRIVCASSILLADSHESCASAWVDVTKLNPTLGTCFSLPWRSASGGLVPVAEGMKVLLWTDYYEEYDYAFKLIRISQLEL